MFEQGNKNRGKTTVFCLIVHFSQYLWATRCLLFGSLVLVFVLDRKFPLRVDFVYEGWVQ